MVRLTVSYESSLQHYTFSLFTSLLSIASNILVQKIVYAHITNPLPPSNASLKSDLRPAELRLPIMS